jgi:hypothetical protein
VDRHRGELAGADRADKKVTRKRKMEDLRF